MTNMIGARIKLLREAAHLSQVEFADKTHVARSYISLIESDKRDPSDLYLGSVLSAFPQISETWLRTGEGDMYRKIDESMPLDGLSCDDLIEMIMETYHQLDEAHQKALYDFANSLFAQLRKKKPELFGIKEAPIPEGKGDAKKQSSSVVEALPRIAQEEKSTALSQLSGNGTASVDRSGIG